MPTVTLLSETMPVLLPMQGRSPLVHVSNVINLLCVQLGHYDERREMNQAQLELGCAWEWASIARYAREAPNRYLQCGELILDDIAGTPDLLDLDLEAVHEFKATWMSPRHGPGSKKLWKWELQQKSYCKMMGWTRSVLEVAYVNIPYGMPGGPVLYRRWGYVWSQAELDAGWRTITQHAPMVAESHRG